MEEPELVSPKFSLSIADEDAQRLPERIDCQACGKHLIAIEKDPVHRKLNVKVLVSKVPEIVNRGERRGFLECPSCKAKTPIDLAIFGALPQPTRPVIYCNCMEEVKARIAVVLRVVENGLTIGREDFDAELVCVQLRKVLELIAFASLTANKESYAEIHKDFESHWNAKQLLVKLERIHPHFYPKPVQFNRQDEKGIIQSEDVAEGYLTRDEFVILYQKCSEVLHARNPFRSDPRVINFGISIRDWVSRIQRLLAVHYMQLAGTETRWVVFMEHPEDGKVHALTSEPVDVAG